MSTPAEHQELFSGFDHKTKKDWIRLATSDLKGADFSKKLVWHSPDGFDVDPFYTLEDAAEFEYLSRFHNVSSPSKDRPGDPRSWQYLEMVSSANENKANSLAREGLQMGADGIIFLVPETRSNDPSILFSGLDPNINPLVFRAGFLPDRFIGDFFEYYSGLGTFQPEDISGALDFDPLREFTLSGHLETGDIDGLAALIRQTDPIKNFRALTVNGSHFLNAGASTSIEIALSLNAMVEYLDRFTASGLSARQVVDNLRFSLAVGTDYFMEIAKLKAIRMLIPFVVERFGKPDTRPGDIMIHCDTSLWTKTIYDPHVNMLRNTTEAMSAITGGTDSLSILPFDILFNRSNGFSRRISRNISNLLREESYFNKVIDPAAGSFYIEALTDKLADKSLEVFREIESAGGFVQAFNKGIIRKKITEACATKHHSVSARRQIIVGTNQYANPDEKVSPGDISLEETNPAILANRIISSRASVEFEKLRLATDDFANRNGEEKRPDVFLSLVGENKVMRKARATFAYGFFASAGFRIKESNPSPSLFESVQKAIDSRADVVVICGGDEDYISDGADFARAYKANGNAILVIAGNPQEARDRLLEAGIDEFIHIKTDVIESLHRFQLRLDIVKA